MKKKLTEQQEKDIELIGPWAMSALSSKYDRVTLFKTVDNIDVYMLTKTEWGMHHKIGMPILAIIENNRPVLLSKDEVLGVIAS